MEGRYMSDDKAETLGERIARLRTQAGLTQVALAEKASVPLGTLRNWEQGQREPLASAAVALALALGVSADELLDVANAKLPGPATPPPEPTPPAKRGRPAKPRAGDALPSPGAAEGKAKKGKRTEG